MTVRILACDDISSVGLDVLRAAGFEVVSRPGISRSDLVDLVSGFDAVLVRSRTHINKAVLDAAIARYEADGSVDLSACEKLTEEGLVGVLPLLWRLFVAGIRASSFAEQVGSPASLY